MITIKKEDRAIFSICINYRYAEHHTINNIDFFKAHLSEHLVLVNACKQLKYNIGELVGIEKFISGLTNIENSCFQLSASNQYISYINDFIESVCFHDLGFITEEDFIEQSLNVLKEYDFAKDSFQGRCNSFHNFINDLDDIDYKTEIEHITFENIRYFINKRFNTNNCDLFYCGKTNNELPIKASIWERKTIPIKVPKRQYRIKKQCTCIGFHNNEVWFAYHFPQVSSIHDYLINEIVAKIIQILVILSNKSRPDIKISNIGTHYTDRCIYALYSANALYDTLNFSYSHNQVYVIANAVKKEYETRLLLKNDSLLENIKFYKKLYYITGKPETHTNIKKTFDELDINEISNQVESIYENGVTTIMQFVEE